MEKINLIDINVENVEDQNFLYDILKYRWSKSDIINIFNNNMPTFEEHLCNLKSGNYKKHYRVNIGNFSIGSIYLDNTNTWGIFILPSLLKKCLKKYHKSNTELHNNEQHLSLIVAKQLIALNPDIKKLYANINFKNKSSINAFLKAGFTPSQIIFENYCKDGKLLGDNWCDL